MPKGARPVSAAEARHPFRGNSEAYEKLGANFDKEIGIQLLKAEIRLIKLCKEQNRGSSLGGALIGRSPNW